MTRYFARETPMTQHAHAGGFALQRLRALAGIAAMALGMPPAPAQCPPTWTQSPTGGPPPRNDAAMTYDEIRGVAVLFGGYNGGSLGDTWECDGIRWTERAVSGPPARVGHALAYDRVRGVSVLFGGLAVPNTYFRDTWEWNGETWVMVSSSGPAARTFTRMAYDDARHETVLFGGRGPNALDFNDTWVWNGTVWTQRLPTGPRPSARDTHALVYDVARQRVVLFGGDNGMNQGLNDTWEWNGTGWIPRQVAQRPAWRLGHGMAYDAARQVTVLFGGWDIQLALFFGDTWEWNGTAWTQRTTSGPGAQALHVMTFELRHRRTLLLGGTDPPSVSQTWIYSADTLAGDINEDCAVDGADASLLAAALVGSVSDPKIVLRSDLNRDGVTDGDDIQVFVELPGIP